jgi:hypothetical protein
MKCLLRKLGLVICITSGLLACAHATPVLYTSGPFNCTFYNTGDSDGTQTSTQDWTSTQIQDVLSSTLVWSQFLKNTPSRSLEMHLFWTNYAGLTLGGSYNPYVARSGSAYTQTEYIWRAGGHMSVDTDLRIVYDTDAAGYSWNFGTGSPSGSQIDFRSVITHEIGHSVGFASTYLSSTDKWWTGGITAWDGNLMDSSGNRPSAGTSGTPGNFNQVDNPVYFTGPNAVAFNGGANVPIYAPDPYAAGSSLTHVNEGTFPGDLMSPSIMLGEEVRQPTLLDLAIMKDIGWNVEIPEPGTASLLLVFGLACMGFRRCRTV